MTMDIATDQWYNCYGKTWKGIVVSETTRHPAKFSRLLIQAIYDHLLDVDLLQAGDLVFDPFGGCALGAWPAITRGIRHVSIEIEKYFFDMAKGCLCSGLSPDLWLRFAGRPAGLVDLGDRHICPECIEKMKNPNPPDPIPYPYKRTERQKVIDKIRARHKMTRRRWFGDPDLPGLGRRWAYQAGLMGLADPDPLRYNRNTYEIPRRPPHRYYGNIDLWHRMGFDGCHIIHGDSTNLIELLTGRRPAGLISSPPFGRSVGSGDPDKKGGLFRDPARSSDHNLTAQYGSTPGQLGIMDEKNGSGFWIAARAIVTQCFAILPSGAPAVWHTKDFVKKGKVIRFSEEWRMLCESVGFRTLHRHHAMMVDQKFEQLGLIGESEKIGKDHLGFFRRHQNRLNPAAVVEHETVFCMVKP